MQLRRLIVSNGIEIIRDITFKEGLNIITNEGHEGNQIGKSTVLRVLNFCLGSDGENIWKDPDSKNINQAVYDLVTNGSTSFQLHLNISNVSYVIKRTIEQKLTGKGVQLRRFGWINDKPFNSVEKFKDEIARIFGYVATKPKFTAIRNRFIRINKSTANRVFKFQNLYTSDDEYVVIYSHLFGFEGHNELTQIIETENESKLLESRVTALLGGRDEQHYLDQIESLDQEISLLQAREDSYDITGIQNETISKLKSLRSDIANYSTEIVSLETKILYNCRTIESYKSKVEHVDVKTITSIYNEALALLPEVKRTLDETIEFHNSVFIKKAEFVSKQVLELEGELSWLKTSLDKCLTKEKELIKSIANESHLSGFILIEKEIQEKREERGRVAFVVDEIYNIRQQVKLNKNKVEGLKALLEDYSEELEKNLGLFNKYCNAISKKIFITFGLQLNFRFDESGSLLFSIINEDKVAGDGAPRAASMAFDLAMVEYVKSSKAKLPEFNLQDYLEPTDEEKLSELFRIAEKRKIQTVVSILNDKLHLLERNFIEKCTVLELSPDNKFFKI